MALVLNDGQLTTSAASLVTLATASQYLGLTFFNRSSNVTQTVIVQLTRTAAGTARTIMRAVLLPYEALYVRGIGVDREDTLAAYSTQANIVDYTVFIDREESDFSVWTTGADGTRKASTTVSVEVPESRGPDEGQKEMIDLLREAVGLLRKIA